jgi:hypothetical protein
VNNLGKLNEDQARFYFAQLLSALKYLHEEHGVAHRDLKAENVILDRNNNIRLIDFGLSAYQGWHRKLSSACGSPHYIPPEMLLGKSYTKAVDLWSAGILLYAMVAGTLPFVHDDIRELLRLIATKQPQYPTDLSPHCLDLLKKILQKDPSKRLTIDQIRAHPWFTQAEHASIYQMQMLQEDRWHVKTVDKSVVDVIADLGFQTKLLTQSLQAGDYTELTAMYNIVRRGRMTDELDKLFIQVKMPAPGEFQPLRQTQVGRPPDQADRPGARGRPTAHSVSGAHASLPVGPTAQPRVGARPRARPVVRKKFAVRLADLPEFHDSDDPLAWLRALAGLDGPIEESPEQADEPKTERPEGPKAEQPEAPKPEQPEEPNPDQGDQTEKPDADGV